MSATWPNFFIVGAPKSGTTTLYRWLQQHPGVFMSAKKEPLFFCGIRDDFSGPGSEPLNRWIVRDEAEYARLFLPGSGFPLRGEASTDYLAFEGAAAAIHASVPDARIVMVLRNPVERAFSEHRHLLRDGVEPNRSFRRALDLEEERRAAGWIPLFWHKHRGLYAAQVARYLDRFGDRVRIYLYEELSASPGELTADLFRFLGVEPVALDRSTRYNVSRSNVPRSRTLESVASGRRVPGWLKRRAAALLGRERIEAARAWLRSRNRTDIRLHPADRRHLVEYFDDDIVRLERIIGKDLSAWRR